MQVKIDESGRITIPAEYRRRFLLNPGTHLEIVPGPKFGQFIIQSYMKFPPTVDEWKEQMQEIHKAIKREQNS